MKPVTPIVPGAHLPVTVIARDQPQYKPLPAFIENGAVLTRWKLSFRERLRVLLTGDVYHWQQTFGEPLQALQMQTSKPKLFTPEKELQEMYKRGCERTA